MPCLSLGFSTSADNTLLKLHNSSEPTQPHPTINNDINCLRYFGRVPPPPGVITLEVMTSHISILIGSTNTNILGYYLSKKISVKVFFVLTLLFSQWLTPLLYLFYDNHGFHILYKGISWAFLCKKKLNLESYDKHA